MKKHKCSLCGYNSPTPYQLINHMRTHTGEKPYKCTVHGRGMEFKCPASLKAHSNCRHSDRRPFKCNFAGCFYDGKTFGVLKQHMKVHSDDRPFACPNTGCDFQTKRSSLLAHHVTTVHSKDKTFPCSKCDYKTTRNDYLKLHMRRLHSNRRRDIKGSHPQCTKYCKSSKGLQRHFSIRHGKRNVQCDYPGCERKYANLGALHNHKWGRHLIKKCRTCFSVNCCCSNSFNTGGNVKISCSIKGCPYKGINVRAMEAHLHRHKNTLLPCPVKGCSQYAFTKKKLSNHVKLHSSSGRPFQCPLCFKHYRTLSQLQTHCFSHTKEKPLKCGHCKFGNSVREHVKRHLSAAHSNLKFPFIVLPLDERECLHCKVTLSMAEFVVHSMRHAVPVVMIEKLQIRWT